MATVKRLTEHTWKVTFGSGQYKSVYQYFWHSNERMLYQRAANKNWRPAPRNTGWGPWMATRMHPATLAKAKGLSMVYNQVAGDEPRGKVSAESSRTIRSLPRRGKGRR